MLTIRPEQMRVLISEASRSTLAQHANSAHPAAAAVLGPAALDEAVTAVIQRCAEYGLRSTAEQIRVMDLAMVFGADWRRPDLQWLDEGLRDRSVAEPGLRLRRVWRRALRRLAREPACPSH